MQYGALCVVPRASTYNQSIPIFEKKPIAAVEAANKEEAVALAKRVLADRGDVRIGNSCYPHSLIENSVIAAPPLSKPRFG